MTCVMAATSAAQHCENVLATIDTNGAQAQGPGLTGMTSISADGRYVAFLSSYTLVPGISSSSLQLYVRDVLAGTTELVSVSTAGGAADAEIGPHALSADGRFVAFESRASNLVVNDTNATYGAGFDVFVRDRLVGVTTRVSVGPGGAQALGASALPSISADGRFVAFHSGAPNLVPGDTNGRLDVFVHDRATGVTEIVSVDANGMAGNELSNNASISADGRFVAFLSASSNWAPSGVPSVTDVFVKDRTTGALTFCHLSTAGDYANSHASRCSISGDGRYVAFDSSASNLVVEDGNTFRDVFVRDLVAGTTVRASVTSSDPYVGANAHSGASRISANGRFVVFQSPATNLDAGVANGNDVYVRDLVAGTTTLVSATTAGVPGDGDSSSAAISDDGGAIAYSTNASNLVPGDSNGGYDVVELRRDCLPPPSLAFCSGDGSGTACPCGNSGASGNGCASSIAPLGANLSSSGIPSVAHDTFVLQGASVSNSVALYFQGTARVNGGAGSVFGDGLRCAGGVVARLGTETSSGGVSRYPSGGQLAISVQGNVPSGATRTYQCWYRNSAAFCTAATWNLTNGIEATWAP